MVNLSGPLKVASGVAVIAILIVGWWLISPNFLPGPSMDQDLEPAEAIVLLSGSLQEVNAGHKGSGIVQLAQYDTENQSIFFQNVTITNGPDLYVFLSKSSSFSGTDSDPGQFVSLGVLPAVRGTFSVAVPDDINGTDYASVLIWCQAFSVLFTYAILE